MDFNRFDIFFTISKIKYNKSFFEIEIDSFGKRIMKLYLEENRYEEFDFNDIIIIVRSILKSDMFISDFDYLYIRNYNSYFMKNFITDLVDFVKIELDGNIINFIPVFDKPIKSNIYRCNINRFKDIDCNIEIDKKYYKKIYFPEDIKFISEKENCIRFYKNSFDEEIYDYLDFYSYTYDKTVILFIIYDQFSYREPYYVEGFKQKVPGYKFDYFKNKLSFKDIVIMLNNIIENNVFENRSILVEIDDDVIAPMFNHNIRIDYTDRTKRVPSKYAKVYKDDTHKLIFELVLNDRYKHLLLDSDNTKYICNTHGLPLFNTKIDFKI